MRVCAKCGEEKPATTEHFHRSGRGGRYLNKYCKACASIIQREKRKSDGGRTLEIERQSYARHKEDKHARWREYRKVNIEKERERFKEWRQSTPTHQKARDARRRARKLKSDGYHTRADVMKAYLEQGGKCHWCGAELNKKYHVDHIIPLARGGDNWPENICCSCATCNQSKGDKLPSEWERLL